VSDPKEIVRRGYDAIAGRYAEWSSTFETPEAKWIEELLTHLDDNADVLDLGCGGGSAAAQAVAGRHRYTGVDLSTAQIERARERIPQSRFLTADVTQLELEPESFDAVMSLFMFGHIPRAEQAPLLARVRGWLRPGGWLLTTMGTSGSDDEVEDDWLGAPMFFASFDPETNRSLLTEAGFEIVHDRVIAHDEPGHGPVSFMWVLARRVERSRANRYSVGSPP
jgi:cyclopropane fatty-acyl-phospholipid synthase-like methyltransferase